MHRKPHTLVLEICQLRINQRIPSIPPQVGLSRKTERPGTLVRSGAKKIPLQCANDLDLDVGTLRQCSYSVAGTGRRLTGEELTISAVDGTEIGHIGQ